jgi:hypothetical protein
MSTRGIIPPNVMTGAALGTLTMTLPNASLFADLSTQIDLAGPWN